MTFNFPSIGEEKSFSWKIPHTKKKTVDTLQQVPTSTAMNKLTALLVVLSACQILAIEVTCSNYRIEFSPDTPACLPSEYEVFVNGISLSCIAGDDSFLYRTTNIISTLCNKNISAEFIGDYPKQSISCNNHNIEFITNSDACFVADEWNVLVDGTSFLCVVQNDSYSLSVMQLVSAFCTESDIEVSN